MEFVSQGVMRWSRGFGCLGLQWQLPARSVSQWDKLSVGRPLWIQCLELCFDLDLHVSGALVGDESIIRQWPVSSWAYTKFSLRYAACITFLCSILQSNYCNVMIEWGFHLGCHWSTTIALLSLTNEWHKILEQGQSVGVVFFDLKKAFDCTTSTFTAKT